MLQIDCLCMEQTDESIREALRNLPPDLSTTYDRILRRSEYRRGRSYQRQILSFLLAALRPLEINELREALAVVPGDTHWKSDNQVNNVYHALTCCESLVIVAEEERTVHFVHQSVVQFLLDQKSTSGALRFDLAQASLELGEVCVTYLNYEIFEQRVSTNVVPTIPAGVIPAKIAQDTLRGSSLVGQLALMLLNFQSSNGPDIGKILTETSRLHRKRQETATFEFLKYASQHWLVHTVRIEHTHNTFSLWQGLLQNPKFDGLVWGPNETHPDKLLVDGQSGNTWTLPPRVTWAISHSHLPLLLLELRSRRGLKALCSIIPYIRVLVKAGDMLKVDQTMALKLFEVAVVAEADDVANLLLRIHQTSCPRETFLEPFVKRRDPARVGWTISLKSFGDLDRFKLPIVELVCRARNLQFLNLALGLGARIDIYDQNPLVLLIEEMRDPLDLALACRLLKAGFSMKGCDGMHERLYWFLRYYTLVNDPENFDPHRAMRYSSQEGPDSIAATFENLVRRACYNGNLQMVQNLFSRSHWPTVGDLILTRPGNYTLWMADALCTYSTDRREIVRLLGQLFKLYHGGIQLQPRKNPGQWHSRWLGIFLRCLQLRAWKLAEIVRHDSCIQAESFRKVLSNFTDDNMERDGDDMHPNAGGGAQLELGTACEDQGQSETNSDSCAANKSEADEYEGTAFETSSHISIVHLSISCGDVAGVEYLLDVLGTDAHTILSAPSPLHSCFGGEVPLQTLLTQEQLTLEETANFLRIGDMILERISAHGTSACGQKSKSCVNLVPWFCVKVVHSITSTRRGRKVLIPGTRSYRFLNPGGRPHRVLDDLQSKRCLPLLETFLKTWIAHISLAANCREILLPMLDAIVRDFGEVKAVLESLIPQDENKLEPILRAHSRDHVELGFILVRSLRELGIDDMFERLLLHDPFLQDDIASFKKFLFNSTIFS